MAQTQHSTQVRGAAGIRAVAASRDRRYPRAIARSEVAELPRLHLRRGQTSTIFITRERDDARYFNQAIFYMEPDCEPFEWDQSGWDESYFVLKGHVHLGVTDIDGNETEVHVDEGDFAYVPAGYDYVLYPSGVYTEVLCVIAPSFRAGLGPLTEVGVAGAKEYSKALTELRGA